jgi:hypothetical protein
VRGDEVVEAREVHVRLPLEVAKAELSSLPEGRLKEELRKVIKYAEFWNFPEELRVRQNLRGGFPLHGGS